MVTADIIFKTPDDGHYFFGYYDKPQLNKNNNKFLCLKVKSIDHVPAASDIAELGYFDFSSNNNFVLLGTTKTFNWQQGCMLQWLGPDFNNKVIYNDLHENKFASVILDLNTGKKKYLELPIYTVHPNGNYALCIDQERHHWCRRGYSYDGVENDSKNKNIVDNDGIWLLDLDNNKTKKILNLVDLIKIKPLSNMNNAVHYVEHLMFNPSGTRFCFLHRWKMEGGGIYSRLYTADMSGENLYIINDSGRVGHFSWRSDNEMLLYGGMPNKINKLRKYKSLVKYFFRPIMPLYHFLIKDNSKISKALTGDSYMLLKDLTQNKQKVASEISSEDGHPSFSLTNKRYFITDTYPDPENESKAKLLLYDLQDKQSIMLDTLNSLGEYDVSPLRCDLHPRWSYDGNYLSVDTMNDSVRSSYLYKIKNIQQ